MLMNISMTTEYFDKMIEEAMNQKPTKLRMLVHPEDVKAYKEFLGPGVEVIGMDKIYEPDS